MSEEELKEELERYERQNQEAYDMQIENEIKRKRIAEEAERQALKRKLKGEVRQKQRRDRKQVQSGGNTGEKFIPDKTEDFAPAPDRDMRTDEPIYDTDEEKDQFGRLASSIAFETGANTLLDIFSFIPPAQVAGSGVINYIAQRIRGGEFSYGELVASGLASLIPGGAQGTAAAKLAKSTAKGAVSGGVQTTSMIGIDEGRLPTAEELATGAGLGGAFGGLFQTIGNVKQVDDFLYQTKRRLQGGDFVPMDNPFAQGSVGAAKLGSKGFGSLPDDGTDLSEFLANKRNRFDIADESVRKANLDPKSPVYKRIQRAARGVPEFVRRNDDGFLYFDYRLFRDSMRPKQYGRAYIELFETDLDVLLSGKGGTAGTKMFKEFNIAEFRDTFQPAAELLGLTGKHVKGRMDVSNVHHIAALKGIMGIYDGLGFNSPMYKRVNAAMKESLDGLGSEQENFIRLVGGTADVDSPHYLAHIFLSDAIGPSGEKFFTDNVLISMATSDSFRESKARELGKIIADSAKVAERAQDAYKRLADAALATDYKDIQDTMARLLTSKQLGYVKLNNVNYKPIVREKATSGGYNVRQFDELIEDISLIHKAIPTGSPKLIDEILFSPQLRKSQKSFQKLVTKIEEKFGEQGVTGAEMRKILDAFDVRMQNAGVGQTGLFEDIPDNLIEDVLNNLKAKKQARFTKRNQEKYKKNPNP